MKRQIASLGAAIALAVVLFFLWNNGIITLSDVSAALTAGLVSGIFGVLIWGFKQNIRDVFKGAAKVIIQEKSFRFNKYPFLVVNFSRNAQRMPNMVYAEVTIENSGKIKAKECELEITMKGNKVYKSKVLSADSTKTPNPMNVSIDPNGGTVGFHPLCVRLDTLDAFLPNYSLGAPGVFSGMLIQHAEYEVLARTLCEGKQGELVSLGNIKVPTDLIEKGKVPDDIQVTIDQGGFAVYLERLENKVRARFLGHSKDDDIRKIAIEYLEKIPQIDHVIENNGHFHSWESLSKTGFDRRFDHVEARLFYPLNIKYENGERDPRKNNPRHKLILMTDLRKAYRVGKYAWNLIYEDRIRWHSEDEQNLEEWCKKEGYTLIPLDVTEDRLLEPYSEAVMVNKKEVFKRGEIILFKTRYRGELVKGFFSNQIFTPESTTFSNGLDRTSSWAPDTLESGDPNIGGKLNGYVNHESRWSWGIPPDAPLGQYRIYMRVHNHFRADSRPTVAQFEDTFTVQ